MTALRGAAVPARIAKTPRPGDPPPNLADYEQARRAFSWEQARAQLDGLADGRGLNIAHEAVDRHAAGAHADTIALRWLAAHDGARREISYRELRELTRQRLALGDARVLVTTPRLYRRKVAPVRDALPGLLHVLLVGESDEVAAAACPGRSTCAPRSTPRPPSGRSRRPTPSSSRCCTSRAARPARRRARCTCTRRSWRTTRPGCWRSTCTPATSSGAQPTPAG